MPMVPADETCARCPAPPFVLMHIGGKGETLFCFACADALMLELAPENVRGGSTIEQTAGGYARWRMEIGRPLSMSAAIAKVREACAS